MRYGVKFQYSSGFSRWGYPALSFANKCIHLDGTFITDNINEAFSYQNELQLYDINHTVPRIWRVEERE